MKKRECPYNAKHPDSGNPCNAHQYNLDKQRYEHRFVVEGHEQRWGINYKGKRRALTQ